MAGCLPASFEGDEEAIGLGSVFGFEALEFASDGVEGVVNALATEEQTVAIFHSSISFEAYRAINSLSAAILMNARVNPARIKKVLAKLLAIGLTTPRKPLLQT